ncbi:flagellar assembly protein FliW [Sutcliffiella cohnii]
MNIETKYHGSVEVNEKDIISFPRGIPGFLEETEFIFIPFTEDDLFQILQSVKTANIAFVLTNPFTFFPEYDFQLDESALEILQLEKPEDALVYSILTVSEKMEESTANLQAPIIVNKQTLVAKQVILTGTNYKTKHPLFRQHEEVK